MGSTTSWSFPTRSSRLPQSVPVQLQVFALDGRRVAQVERGQQGSGPQRLHWDGRDQRGETLAPGVYLLGIGIEAEDAAICN